MESNNLRTLNTAAQQQSMGASANTTASSIRPGAPSSEFRKDDMLPANNASKAFRSYSQSHIDDPYFFSEATQPLRINRKHSTSSILSPSSSNTPFSPVNSSSLSTPVSTTSNMEMQPPSLSLNQGTGGSGSNNSSGKSLPLNSPKSNASEYKTSILFNSNKVSSPSTALDSVLRSKKQTSSPERYNNDRNRHGRAVSIDNIRYLNKSNNNSSNNGTNHSSSKQVETSSSLSSGNVPQPLGNNSSGAHNNNNNGVDFETRNIDMTNAYFKRLSMLPEIPTEELPPANLDQVMTVSRKLLFVFSETYQAFKKFNVIYSSSNQTKLRGQIMAALSQCKKQVNGLVVLLENSDANTNSKESTGKYIDQVLCHLVATIITLKQFLRLMIKNIKEVTRSSDVCFIRLLILSMYGCHNEIYNAWVILNNQDTSSKASKKNSNNSSLENVHKSGTSNTTSTSTSTSTAVTTTAASNGTSTTNMDNNDIIVMKKNDENINSNDGENEFDKSNSIQESEDEKLFQTAQPGINKSLNVAETVLKLITSNGKESELLKKAESECHSIIKLTKKMLLYLSYRINNDTEKWMIKKQSFFKKMGQLVLQNINLLKYLKELIPEFPEIMSLRAEITALSKISKSLIALSEPPATSTGSASASTAAHSSTTITQAGPSS